MNRTARRCLIVAALLGPLAPAHAQLYRAYLASDGSDANPCTLPAPCRLLPAALNAVANGGEIWMLDSANYNTGLVVVGKSVSIQAVPGAVGSLVSTGGLGTAAIRVEASLLRVTLRNVAIGSIAGGAAAYYGIHLTGASTVIVEQSVLANMVEGARVAGNGELHVVDTAIRNNSGWGINAQLGGTATVTRSQLIGNGNGGVLAYGYGSNTTTTVNVFDSVISHNDGAGVIASTSNGTAIARASVSRSRIDGNLYGVRAETDGPDTGFATVWASGNTIVNNTGGWYQSGAGSVIYSTLDNLQANNGGNSGAVTPLAMQ